MNTANLAWAAGIVDGEGCISIGRLRAYKSRGLRSDNFRLNLKVTMGDKATVERIHAIVGQGTVHPHVFTNERGQVLRDAAGPALRAYALDKGARVP